MSENSNSGYILYASNAKSDTSQIINISKPQEIFRFRHAHAFIDNKLYLCHKFGTWQKNAETFTPDCYCEAEKGRTEYIYRINFSVQDSMPYHNIKYKWTACFIGARVSSPHGDEANPLHKDCGFYIAIGDSNKAVIYHGKERTWPHGCCTVKLPENFSTPHTLIVTDDGETITYSMILSTGEERNILKACLSGEDILVYDSGNNLVYKEKNNLRNRKGGYFKVFNHEAQTIISSVSIHNKELKTGCLKMVYKDSFSSFRTSEGFKLFYITQGESNCLINQNLLSLEKDDILLISAYDTYLMNENMPMTKVQFNKEFLYRYFSHDVVDNVLTCFNNKQIRLKGEKLSLIRTKLQNLKESENEDDRIPAFIHLYEILFLLSREKKGVIRDASHNPYVYKIINYINKYYSTIFTVDDIAEYCGVSKHHLCRVFKENMNMTIISFLNQAKVNNACKELVETDNQILQIALNNGFNSASYFNYVFKKQTGISPIEYRIIHTKKSK